MSFVSSLKTHTPWPVRQLYRRLRVYPIQSGDSRRSAKEVFTEIYSKNIWDNGKPHADSDFPFYSGPGSGEQSASPYAECVNRFISDNRIKTVLDLGCGDFRVGKLIARPSVDYTGVDIVEPLIQANQMRFGSDRIRFRCLDIINEALPVAELCLVREVLQHLSNAQIVSILSRLKAFRWVVVTEAHPGPLGSFKPNRDKPHGRESRALWNSGVVLNAPPFNVPDVALLLEVPVAGEASGTLGSISSFLIRN